MSKDNAVKAYRSQFPEHTQSLWIAFLFTLILDVTVWVKFGVRPFLSNHMYVPILWNILSLSTFLMGLVSKSRTHHYAKFLWLYFLMLAISFLISLQKPGAAVLWNIFSWIMILASGIEAAEGIYLERKYRAISILRVKQVSQGSYAFKLVYEKSPNELVKICLEAVEVENFAFSAVFNRRTLFETTKSVRNGETVIFDVSTFNPPPQENLMSLYQTIWMLSFVYRGKKLLETPLENIPFENSPLA